MTIPAELLEQVRRHANWACEYCGVTETDTGAPLTVDHIHPRTHGGTDDFANLVYCCYRCNLNKGDYWPIQQEQPLLWNPRQELISAHLLLLADGTLHPVSWTGDFTLRRLRLNRPQLVAARLRRRDQTEESRHLAQLQEVVALVEALHQRQVTALEQHNTFLQTLESLLINLASRVTDQNP